MVVVVVVSLRGFRGHGDEGGDGGGGGLGLSRLLGWSGGLGVLNSSSQTFLLFYGSPPSDLSLPTGFLGRF